MLTFHEPMALKSLPIKEEAEWTPLQVWTLWKKEGSFAPTGNGRTIPLPSRQYVLTISTELPPGSWLKWVSGRCGTDFVDGSYFDCLTRFSWGASYCGRLSRVL